MIIGDICVISNYLAYAMATYCIASVFYIVRTRHVGTPLNDSLTKKQLEIKAATTIVRRNIFYQGLAAGALICFLFRPFDQC
jgi:hypothetical protein